MLLQPSSLADVAEVGRATVVKFTQPTILDDADLRALDRLFDALLAQGACRLVLNFEDVRRMTSETLARLLVLNRKAKQQGGRVVLCALPPDVRGIFEATRLDQVFRICGDEMQALQSF